jgi:hypothetical protein
MQSASCETSSLVSVCKLRWQAAQLPDLEKLSVLKVVSKALMSRFSGPGLFCKSNELAVTQKKVQESNIKRRSKFFLNIVATLPKVEILVLKIIR